MAIKKFQYQNQEVEFEIANENIMVNATEMAKIFGKETYDFYHNENVQNFVKAFCQTDNCRFEDEFSPAGTLIKVVKGGNNPGTWMHRVVALKFAAWLDPFFEVWVYSTIDQLLFGSTQTINNNLRELYSISVRKKEVNSEINKLMKEHKQLEKREKELLGNSFVQLGFEFPQPTGIGTALSPFHAKELPAYNAEIIND